MLAAGGGKKKRPARRGCRGGRVAREVIKPSERRASENSITKYESTARLTHSVAHGLDVTSPRFQRLLRRDAAQGQLRTAMLALDCRSWASTFRSATELGGGVEGGEEVRLFVLGPISKVNWLLFESFT